jgi:ectoine hydroxylase-related dioxygenase (phytanoyl-CoA dioxygenase family)/SAM-dependent methyltransferase
VNGLLSRFDLHLSRASNFHGLKSELFRTQAQLDDVLKKQEHERLLELSKLRWRADEPDAGLTWGVPMVGDEFVRFLLMEVTLKETSTIVEIGPGYGRILGALLKQGIPFKRYIGLEISSTRVARLCEQFRDPRIEFREADILSSLDLNAVADLTFSSAVFEHFYPDFGAAMDTISQFTRTGGAVVIDFIRDDKNPEHSAAWFDQETYMRTYSSRELEVLFERNGFALNKISRISFGRDILNREITRTIVFGTRKGFSGPSIESLVTPSVQSTVGVKPFDTFVQHSSAPSDHGALDPPVKPEFRSPFGGLWTDLNTADAILAGKVAIGDLLPGEANLVNAWKRDGLVILPGAVDVAAIDAALVDFESAYDGRLNLKMSYWDDRGLHIEDASRQHVRKKDAKLLDIHDVSEAIRAIQFSEPVSRFLRILFERPALAFQSLGFYYGSQQHLHQDSAFVRVNSPLEFVASWIALEDVSAGSGELEYYPGSHAVPHHLFGGKRLWVKYDDPELERFSDILHDQAKQAGLSLRRFLPKKGDVLIWSAGLMHGGSPVTDLNRTRKSLVTHYCPADLQPMFAYKGGRTKRKSVAGHYVIAEHWDYR